MKTLSYIVIIFCVFQVKTYSQTFFELGKINYYLNELKINNVFILPESIKLSDRSIKFDSIKVAVIYTLSLEKNISEVQHIARIQCYKKNKEKVYTSGTNPKFIKKIKNVVNRYIQSPVIIFRDREIDESKYYVGVYKFIFCDNDD